MAYVAMTAAEEEENLRDTLAMLNDTSKRLKDWQGKNWSHDDAVRMRRMVRAWIAADRSLLRIRLDPGDRRRLENFTTKISVTTRPNGEMLVVDFYTPDTAAKHFTRLIRNSQQWRLCEPCLRDTCGRWFVAKTKRERHDFCSRKCAGSAVQARKRNRDKDRKLRKAQRAIENYPARPARFGEMDWKQYVSEATGVSKRFLTMAVQRGELVPPTPKLN